MVSGGADVEVVGLLSGGVVVDVVEGSAGTVVIEVVVELVDVDVEVEVVVVVVAPVPSSGSPNRIGVVDPGLGFQPGGGLGWDGTGPAVGTTTATAGWAAVGVPCGGTGVPG